MRFRGRIHKFGDNIDTDAIIPARYLSIRDPEELAKHCMEGVDPDFPKKAKRGDILIAGRNFGMGSSREHAPLALKALGISCVVAQSFARIFFRNAINIGLPAVECPEALEIGDEGDEVEVDLLRGEIENPRKKQIYRIRSFPPFIIDLISCGGLVEYTRRKLKDPERGKWNSR